MFLEKLNKHPVSNKRRPLRCQKQISAQGAKSNHCFSTSLVLERLLRRLDWFWFYHANVAHMVLRSFVWFDKCSIFDIAKFPSKVRRTFSFREQYECSLQKIADISMKTRHNKAKFCRNSLSLLLHIQYCKKKQLNSTV